MLNSNRPEDWDFSGVDTRSMTHGLHSYPSRMVPQIAKRLIDMYGTDEDRILDPFCGSGGVLVEAVLSGRDAVGFDINPLACMIARVKTTPLDPELLHSTWSKMWNEISSELVADDWSEIQRAIIRLSRKATSNHYHQEAERINEKLHDLGVISGIPLHSNLFYWFKPAVVRDLALIKKFVESIPEGQRQVKEFFSVCLSATIRVVSGTRKGEFKLFRIPEEDWNRYEPRTLEIFRLRVVDSIERMAAFFNAMKGIHARAEIFLCDSRILSHDRFSAQVRTYIVKNPIGLVVTSPPYGDSRTTVAYGQFTRYSLLWLGFEQERVLSLDSRSLGGNDRSSRLESPALNRTFCAIPSIERAAEVKSYFADLADCINEIGRIVKPGTHVCFVLGNRTVNEFRIPTDMIFSELGRTRGFATVEVFHRSIPSKRMPWKTSPTNVPGKTVKTINQESIVVMRKLLSPLANNYE